MIISQKILRALLVVFVLLIAIGGYSQNMGLESLKKNIQSGANNKFKGQFLKGARNGMGFELEKDGFIYAGDFVKNKFHGIGMQVSTEDMDITGLVDCKTYVGGYKNGKRNGLGRCYSSKGFLIYKGMFENNAPVQSYPSVADSLKTFSVIDLSNGNYYIGEAFDGVPNGMGIIAYDDGRLWQGRFKEGKQVGISLLILQNDEWLTVNAQNGEYEVVSSAVAYKQMDEVRKADVGSALSEAMGSFSKALTSGAEVATKISGKGSIEPVIPVGEENSSFDPSSSTGGGSSTNYKTQYAKWESLAKRHYNSLTNTGHRVKKNGKNIAGGNGQSLNSGNYVMQKKALREAQSQMRSIRQRAAKNGVSISQSEYENVTVSY